MQGQPKNVRELLLSAISKAPFALAGNTRLYEIPGFPDITLREYGSRFKTLRDRLKTTSSLYGVHLLDCNFGQKIYTDGGNIDILYRVPGYSLRAYEEKFEAENKEHGEEQTIAYWHSKAKLLALLKELPDRAFEDLFSSVQYLTQKGMSADPHWGNILFDEDKLTLHLVDVHPQELAPTGKGRKEMMATYNHLGMFERDVERFNEYAARNNFLQNNPAIKEKIQQLTTDFNKRLTDAAKKVGFPKNEAELEPMLPRNLKEYRDYRKVRGKKSKLLLDEPVESFREKLDLMRAYSQAQER